MRSDAPIPILTPPTASPSVRRRRIGSGPSLAGLVLLLLAASCNGTPVPQNVLLITLDTTRADALGSYGGPLARTPRLDALAAESVRFENAITTAPYTGPAHASLLTGLYPPQHGLRDFLNQAMVDSVPTMAELLRSDGYATAAFLSSFVLDRRFGLARGFEVYSCDFWRDVTEGENPRIIQGAPSFERDGARTIDEALAWLVPLSPKQPFLAWVHLFDPHAPYAPPAEFQGGPPDGVLKGEELLRQRYYDEVAHVDFQVGRLLDWLEQSGRDERTILVVAGDHGELLGLHGRRMGTHSTHVVDETLRVPLIVRVPGRAPAIVGSQVGLVDVLPTVLELLGIEEPPGLAGRDLPGLTNRGDAGDRPAYSETLYEHFPAVAADGEELLSVRANGWKLVRSPGWSRLYDLRSDPDELRDVATEHPAELERLESALAELQRLFAAHRRGGSLRLLDEERREHLEGLRSLGYVQ